MFEERAEQGGPTFRLSCVMRSSSSVVARGDSGSWRSCAIEDVVDSVWVFSGDGEVEVAHDKSEVAVVVFVLGLPLHKVGGDVVDGAVDGAGAGRATEMSELHVLR